MKIKFFVATALSILSAFPATALNIKVVSSKAIKDITINLIENGESKRVFKFDINADETKSINIPDKNGMFSFEVENVISYCYFKDDKLSTVTIGNNNMVENKSLEMNRKLGEWATTTSSMREIASKFYLAEKKDALFNTDSCMNAFISIHKKGEELVASSKRLKEDERNLLKLFIGVDFDCLLFQYSFVPLISYSLKVPEELKKIVIIENKYSDDQLLSIYPRMYSAVEGYLRFAKCNLHQIGSKRVKAHYILGTARNFKSYEQLATMKKNYEDLFTTPVEAAKLKEIENALANITPGNPGYNFAFPDATGKIVTLADFKGKLVYVDVWATWCGPCKAEIPSLVKLEESMHGKEIVFVSISTDKDKNKWLDFIKNSKGVQIHDSENLMCRMYNIAGIPRFLLFDKNGNVISTDAPRPSNPKIADYLIQHL